MNFKLISCEIFTRTVCRIIADSPHTIDPVFTPKEAHEYPDYLHSVIQKEIDHIDPERNYDAVLLLLGLCGNALDGITAGGNKLVIPRAHDCCTLFLGSIEAFKTHFSHQLSASWASPGYMERGSHLDRSLERTEDRETSDEWADLVEQYGEENAAYVWDTLYPPSKQDRYTYISDRDYPREETFHDLAAAQAEKKSIPLEVKEGSNRLITLLMEAEWPDKDFIIVSPGQKIRALYDMDRIMTAEGGRE